MRTILAAVCVTVLCMSSNTKLAAGGQPRVELGERLDRGVIARPMGEGKVYVGWRLLRSDPEGVAFDVLRRVEDGEPVRLNEQPIRQTTDFVDDAAPKGKRCTWSIVPITAEGEGAAADSPALDPGTPAQQYVSIKLKGDYTFQKVGIADLDGDARYDCVIKQPNANIDPYVKYWKPSPDTYKLEAYRGDGEFLWRYDLGWSIERGIWYSPYVVYDLDGDGRAEVAVKTGEGDPRDEDGRVQTGPEYLTILDGLKGEPITQIAWPPRELFKDTHRPYNYASRNQIGIAYLDGKTPHLIVERGTYNVIVVVAYRLRGGKLDEVWRWDNRTLGREYQGQGAHWMHAADVDADGKQEVVIGSAVIDHDGTALWTTGLGHPDHGYVGDIDPARPGLEIYYGMETRQRERNGMCLVDAATGKILWGHEGFTRHVHSRGLCSDIDARHPGWECYSADTDERKRYAWSRLRTCKGEVISEENLGGFGPLAAYWDADPQREIVDRGRVFDYRGPTLLEPIEGKAVVAVADVLGDWREELIVTDPGELRIYTTTIPAKDRRVCLMQDPIYRTDVAHAAMGYWKVPMLGE